MFKAVGAEICMYVESFCKIVIFVYSYNAIPNNGIRTLINHNFVDMN